MNEVIVLLTERNPPEDKPARIWVLAADPKHKYPFESCPYRPAKDLKAALRFERAGDGLNAARELGATYLATVVPATGPSVGTSAELWGTPSPEPPGCPGAALGVADGETGNADPRRA